MADVAVRLPKGASPVTHGRGSKRQFAHNSLAPHRVARHTRARIETLSIVHLEIGTGRPSHTGADRNICTQIVRAMRDTSPVTHGRGSKLVGMCAVATLPPSPVTHGRGSKQCHGVNILRGCSRPSHTGADRNHCLATVHFNVAVSPVTHGRGSKLPSQANSPAQATSPVTHGRGSKLLCSSLRICSLPSPVTHGRGSKHSKHDRFSLA